MTKLFSPMLLACVCAISSCATNHTEKQIDLSQQVSVDDTWKYLEQLQEIANKNNNNRAVGSPGGIASTQYIVNTLKAHNLTPTLQDFKNTKGTAGTNVFVEIKGQSDTITMIGGHYDSVEHGPGINDNGTGTAILLEIIAKIKANNITPKHTLRFAFWDSEEIGVAGSKYYVANLPEVELKKIAQYINVDMVGTKDPTFLITDGDGSSWVTMAAEFEKRGTTMEQKKLLDETFKNLKLSYPVQVKGAEQLEQIFANYLTGQNVKFNDDYLLSNNSDIFPFLGKVPAFGFIMTNETQDSSGAVLYAPCYHQACDDIHNVDKNAFKIALEGTTQLLNQVAIR